MYGLVIKVITQKGLNRTQYVKYFNGFTFNDFYGCDQFFSNYHTAAPQQRHKMEPFGTIAHAIDSLCLKKITTNQ